MRTLGKFGNKTVAMAERAAEGWLARAGGRAASAAEAALLARIGLVFAGLMVAVPALLGLLASPAVAIPVGVALVAAGFLFSAVGAIAWLRGHAAGTVANPQALPVQSDIARACAGAVLFLDPLGTVTAISGRDRDAFLAWMRDPRGRGFFDQLHVSDRLEFMRAVDALRQGQTSASVDLRIEKVQPLGLSGSEQFVHIRLDMTALAGEKGEDGETSLGMIFAQMRDVSEEQALKTSATRKAQEAESANDAKSRFLAAVSHELRTPLNAVLGFSDVLIGEYFGRLENDRQREYVRLIRQSGAHLLSVVNTMLDMSKIEAGRYELMMEPFALSDSVRACEEMLALQAREKGVTLTSRVQRGLGEIVADQRAVQQILINLVGNAIKFTDAGGVVTVDAMLNGGEARITVSDTGIGIAENRLAEIGKPFMQVQNEYTRRYEGTGLGLSLVKGLVALHGGCFAIASRPGEGTVITVSLPADGSGFAADAAGEEASRPVEFPPRLKNAASFGQARHGETDHGQATAKIA